MKLQMLIIILTNLGPHYNNEQFCTSNLTSK